MSLAQEFLTLATKKKKKNVFLREFRKILLEILI